MGGILGAVVGQFVDSRDRPNRFGPRSGSGDVTQYSPLRCRHCRQASPLSANRTLTDIVPPRPEDPLCRTCELLLPAGVCELVGSTGFMKAFCSEGSPARVHGSDRPCPMNDVTRQALSKVPAVTLGFWVIKILATTLGETGGDTVTMTLDWGYLAGVTLFGVVWVALVVAQISAKRFYPILYWATIVASTTFGTTLADFADRSLGIGYTGGSVLLLCCLLSTLGLWHRSEGTVSANTVSTPKVEAFYWATITFSQTLGTALGDWLADTRDFGYERGALVFTAALIAVVALYYRTG